jgi:hypothetical protein
MALPRYYGKKALTELRTKHREIQPKTDALLLKFVGQRFEVPKAGEYARHGFTRRIQTLARCIHNVFRVVPPGAVKVPSRERLRDAQINLQAFLANAYGCIDNLAWVWVHERRLTGAIKPLQVGLRKKHEAVRKSLSQEFQTYLTSRDNWFEYLVEYRDALAHRIPPYIPPGGVRPKDVDAYNALEMRMNDAINHLQSDEYERLLAEQTKLYVFQPVMCHSFDEASGIARFHGQILIDFLTVEEIALKMLDELKRA